jgi:parvulin-like peptidyl-prolyl isomerase
MTRFRLPILVLASLLWSACVQARAETNHSPSVAILARLGDLPVTESDFERFLRGSLSPDEIQNIRHDPPVRRQALDEFFDLLALATKARKDGLDQSISFEKAHALMETKLLARNLQERRHSQLPASILQVDEQEIRRFYEQHTGRFSIPPSFTVRQIMVFATGNPAFPERGIAPSAAKIKAEEARCKLLAGQSWKKVARDYSDDAASNQRGGLVADASFGFFPPEFESAVRQQKPGELGEIVQTAFGYHILLVEQRTDGGLKPFDRVKTEIASELSAKRDAIAAKAWMDSLRAEMQLVKTGAADSPSATSAIASAEVLAMLGEKAIREEDFQWFVRDAFRPEQRTRVLQKPGARLALLQTYLDMRTLAAKARQEGIDKQSNYTAMYYVMEMRLLAEFLQERDKTTPWALPGANEEQRSNALHAYLRLVRAEVGLLSTPTQE